MLYSHNLSTAKFTTSKYTKSNSGRWSFICIPLQVPCCTNCALFLIVWGRETGLFDGIKKRVFLPSL